VDAIPPYRASSMVLLGALQPFRSANLFRGLAINA
jgi:hypothetical protein